MTNFENRLIELSEKRKIILTELAADSQETIDQCLTDKSIEFPVNEKQTTDQDMPELKSLDNIVIRSVKAEIQELKLKEDSHDNKNYLTDNKNELTA